MGSFVIEKGQTGIPGKVVVGGLGTLFMVVAGLMMGFATGALETLGYESRHVSGNGFTSTQSGYFVGLNTFYADKGRKFFAEYETAIQQGSLVVHLYKVGSLPSNDPPHHKILSESGKGTVKFPIQESGLYRISYSGSVLGEQRIGDNYDLAYSIRWGIQ
jgi:hypothetical protein